MSTSPSEVPIQFLNMGIFILGNPNLGPMNSRNSKVLWSPSTTSMVLPWLTWWLVRALLIPCSDWGLRAFMSGDRATPVLHFQGVWWDLLLILSLSYTQILLPVRIGSTYNRKVICGTLRSTPKSMAGTLSSFDRTCVTSCYSC